MSKLFSIDPVNLIVGIVMISGGALYFLNNSSLGALVVGIGIVIELLIKYLQKLA